MLRSPPNPPHGPRTGELADSHARAKGDEPDPLESLATHALAGDRAAMRLLLQRVAPRVVQVVRAVVGPNHPDVDDLAQEALVAFVHALPRFEGRSRIDYYAKRIASRQCAQALKRSRHRKDLYDAKGYEREPTGKHPHRDALAERRREEIRRLLADIPDEQAETLILRMVMGMSLGEVAEATDAPVNTVRSRIRLAKTALRKRIEADPSLGELLEVGR